VYVWGGVHYGFAQPTEFTEKTSQSLMHFRV
jgi:hypothetical protein